MDNQTYNHGYKLRIYPTEEQKELINKYIGVYRYIYNWGISKQEQIYQDKKNGEPNRGFYSFFDLCKLFKMHRDSPGNEWLKEIPNTTPINHAIAVPVFGLLVILEELEPPEPEELP